MRFSERYEYKPVKSTIQIGSMDEDLKNSLWNALDIHYWREANRVWDRNLEMHPGLHSLLTRMWVDHFKLPLDTLGTHWPTTHMKLRQTFFKEFSWTDVYDFVEFVPNNYNSIATNESFMNMCNDFLQREASGYRFLAGQIVPITDESEIAEIEEAAKAAPDPVAEHLKTALSKFADKKEPDYRNSIKESISAVEAMCRIITKDKSATLGKAIKKLKEHGVHIHAALENAFSSLYGYTNDEGGIRHSLIDGTEPVQSEDAKYMLVSCSGFINYLKEKVSTAGMTL